MGFDSAEFYFRWDFFFFFNSIRLFTCTTDNYSHSLVWQYPTMPWKVPRTCLYVQAGDIISGNGLVDCESGMATEKFDGSGRTCSYEKRTRNFSILGKSPQFSLE